MTEHDTICEILSDRFLAATEVMVRTNAGTLAYANPESQEWYITKRCEAIFLEIDADLTEQLSAGQLRYVQLLSRAAMRIAAEDALEELRLPFELEASKKLLDESIQSIRQKITQRIICFLSGSGAFEPPKLANHG